MCSTVPTSYEAKTDGIISSYYRKKINEFAQNMTIIWPN